MIRGLIVAVDGSTAVVNFPDDIFGFLESLNTLLPDAEKDLLALKDRKLTAWFDKGSKEPNQAATSVARGLGTERNLYGTVILTGPIENEYIQSMSEPLVTAISSWVYRAAVKLGIQS